MAQVKILFYEPNTGQEIAGTVKEWDNAPQGKICRGVLIETDSEAVLIAPTEQEPRTIATVQYCTDGQADENNLVWRLPTAADLRLIRRNRRKVADALASVGDSVKLSRYWAQDPETGKYSRVLMRDGSESTVFENPARVRLVAAYKPQR